VADPLPWDGLKQLKRKGEVPIPQQLIVMHATFQRERIGEGGQAWRERVYNVHAIRARWRDGVWKGLREEAFADVGDVWPWLCQLARPATVTWLVCFDLKRHAALTGIFDRLTDGSAFLFGNDYGPGGKSGQKTQRPWKGILHLREPAVNRAVQDRGPGGCRSHAGHAKLRHLFAESNHRRLARTNGRHF
jgi:hypothetical protein